MDITLKDVSYTYQPNTTFAHVALKNVSFHVPSGSYVAIIGHTGSGKSTLIQHLNGLHTPTEGEVTIGNYTLTKERKQRDLKQLRSKVGIVFQYPEHQLFEETVEKDIAFGPTNFGVKETTIKERIEVVLPKVGLSSDLLSRSPFELSGGQMRRVAIAGILVNQPEVYVLDEPTAGLDPRGQKEIMEMFYTIHKEEKATMVLVTHDMEHALQYADYVIILNNGEKYLEGKPHDIFMQREALQNVQLDVPESVQFIQRFNEQFDANIRVTETNITNIAQHIKGAL